MKTSTVSWLGLDWRNFLVNRIQLARLAWAVLICLSISVQADVVYVWSNDGTIQKFSTNGAASVVATNLSGWNGPVGLACDNIGNLFAGGPGGSYIWRFSPDGTSTLVGPGIDSVSALAFDHAGNLYVTIPNYAAIAKLDYGVYGYGRYMLPHNTNYTTSLN